MKQINYVDKSKFGNGAWQNESDSYSWIDEETGFHCVIWRLPDTGHFNGYVGVPSGNSLYLMQYDELSYIEVHGGITFAGKAEKFEHMRIRKNYGTELFDKNSWYFGFDCAHADDLMPFLSALELDSIIFVYRDFNYVKSEIESLAQQLKRLAKNRF